MLIADVIIDITLKQLDRIFQYIIPEEYELTARCGMGVKIPFGNGNRIIDGIIVGIGNRASYDPDKLKTIVELNENAAVLDADLIELADFIRKRYGCTANMALKTVLPVKHVVKTKKKTMVVLKADPKRLEEEFFDQKNNKARMRFLRYMARCREVSKEEALRDCDISLSTVRYFADKKIVELSDSVKYRNPVSDDDMPDAGRITPNIKQKQIIDDFLCNYSKGIRRPVLLHGVTGSGKTLVFLEIIEEMIRQGLKVIVLIPEISLTYQTVTRFKERFGNRVSVINSRLSQGERSDQYRRAKNGEIDIMIGPRSAIFTPFEKLGLIIVDEEHDTSYNSDSTPKYHGIEVAEYRARLKGAGLILASATPDIGTYTKALSGEYGLYTMPERANNALMPQVSIVDMKSELSAGNRSILSEKLSSLIDEKLEKNEQIMLFINRRGYSGFVSCRSCGHAIKCPHCDITLTYHSPENTVYDYTPEGRLICHYCGFSINAVDRCPECGSEFISTFGTGTQKLQKLLEKRYPSKKILRMDADTTKNKGDYDKILKSFENREADILVGTQMIVKGHDFHNVTLVGIIAADMSLFEESYMSAERTYQLLTQALGRAGRGELAGDVVIQTYNPEHYSIVCAANGDYREFYNMEMKYRKSLKYPPSGHICVVVVMSKDEEHAAQFSSLVFKGLKKQGRDVIGPVRASISKINDVYRDLLYIKSTDYEELTESCQKIEEYLKTCMEKGYYKDVIVNYDFDPVRGY